MANTVYQNFLFYNPDGLQSYSKKLLFSILYAGNSARILKLLAFTLKGQKPKYPNLITLKAKIPQRQSYKK